MVSRVVILVFTSYRHCRDIRDPSHIPLDRALNKVGHQHVYALSPKILGGGGGQNPPHPHLYLIGIGLTTDFFFKIGFL